VQCFFDNMAAVHSPLISRFTSGTRVLCVALCLLSAVASTPSRAAGAAGHILLAEAGDAPRRADTPAPAPGSVAVVYPDLGEPYRSIFATIIEGIQDGAKSAVHLYAVAPNTDTAELNAGLKRHGAKVVIALGRQGLKAVSAIERELPLVVGGVLAMPENDHRSVTGISLTPDPALLFSRLRGLAPSVRRVTVVYNPQHNEWLVRLAREAARAQGLELVALEARDLASAARLYENAFAVSDSKRDAIWLPQDATTVDEATILPLVLKEAWNRSVPVFSSSFLHVKKAHCLRCIRTMWNSVARLPSRRSACSPAIRVDAACFRFAMSRWRSTSGLPAISV
jgi:putative tryptophan/tyrosine transport system substrate-binding protein